MTEKNFDDWTPSDYLNGYYRQVEPDEVNAIRYFVEQIGQAPRGPALCFGCGPTLHHVFPIAPHADEIHLADYLPRNLDEIERWRRGEPLAHDWSPFIRYTLECETGEAPNAEAVAQRAALTRQKIVRLAPCDAGLADPLGPAFRGFFSVVLTPFCADSATDDRAVWERYSRNIASLVRPGGLLLTAALRRCVRYKVGSRYFPSANIDESDLRRVLAEDCDPTSIEVDVREVPQHEEQGYSGILLARAVKR